MQLKPWDGGWSALLKMHTAIIESALDTLHKPDAKAYAVSYREVGAIARNKGIAKPGASAAASVMERHD